MHTKQSSALRNLIPIIILIGCLLLPVQSYSFAPNEEFGHHWIARQALGFLKPAVLDDIVDENIFVDYAYQFSASYHFDNCRFEETSDTIRQLYQRTITALDPTNPDLEDAPDAFGQLLHPVQDFYAHSNWVELGRRDLLDNSLQEWPRLIPRSVYNGVTILQGENSDFDLENFRNLSLRPNLPVVDLIRPDGTPSLGLMTGTVPSPPYPFDDCPDRVAVAHGDILGSGPGLNKDKPGLPGFNDARVLAVQQTIHEWCRLVNLVHTRYPQEGKRKLFAAWVADTSRALAACNPPNNVALIIDETGSMSANDPLRRRVEAAKLFIDAANIGDKIAVIGFEYSARTLAPLTTITSTEVRSSLKRQVDQISSIGITNINSGLNTGFQVLAASTEPTRSAALLLTDGEQTAGAYLNESHLQFQQRGWPIYTIGLGAGADAALLTRIAAATGGAYTASTDSRTLTTLYLDISQQLNSGRKTFETDILLHQSEQRQFSFVVPPGQQAISIVTTWPGSDVHTGITSPHGQVIDPTNISWELEHAKEATYELYTLHYPEPGRWRITVTGVDLAPQGEQVGLRATIQGPSTIYLPIANGVSPTGRVAPTPKPTITLVPRPTNTPGSTPTHTAIILPTTAIPHTPTAQPLTPTPTTLPRACTTTSNSWQNHPFTAQTDAFVATFNATPYNAQMDGVIGLSATPADEYRDLAVIVRFNPSGYIDARDGAIYRALTPLPYTPEITYHFRIEANLISHTYNVFVTPSGGSEAILAENFAFRSEQSTGISLNNWASYATKGSYQSCELRVTSATNIPNLTGTWLGSFPQGGSFSFGVLNDQSMSDGYLELIDSSACGGSFHDFGPAVIVGNTFVDYWSNNSVRITITGTFHSSSSASGSYHVVGQSASGPCSLQLDWLARR